MGNPLPDRLFYCGPRRKTVEKNVMMKASLEKNNGQWVHTVSDGSEVMGYVVIDSLIGGRATGGLRMLPDISKQEMRNLARSMTLKFGFLGLPQGGGKAGVIGNPENPLAMRQRRLEQFGTAIKPLLLERTFIPGTDMGTSNEDIRHLLRFVGLKPKRRELRGINSGYYTALSVFSGVKQAMGHVGKEMAGATVAIEGFGKVGSALAELLTNAHTRIVAISTTMGGLVNLNGLDIPRLKTLAKEEKSRVVLSYPEAEWVDPKRIPELPVDVFCPCARHDSIHAGNVQNVRARFISSGANNPVTAQAEHLLFERGVLCLPDFVTNCGGVLGGTMEFAGINRRAIETFIESNLGTRIAWILDESDRRSLIPTEIATALSLRRFEEVRLRLAHPTPGQKFFQFALELYRRGYIPAVVVASLSLPFFKKRLANDSIRRRQ
jgi:glutamate dehydrogenase/leucine dehydrogenase